MPKQLTVSWSQTEDFTHTFDVDDDLDADDTDALEELIGDLDQDDLTKAFEGCTDLTISDVTEATE